jgi:hypothetical protein
LTGEATRFGARDYICGIAWSPDSRFLAVADRAGLFRKESAVTVRIYSEELVTAKTNEELLKAAQHAMPELQSLAEVRRAAEAHKRQLD